MKAKEAFGSFGCRPDPAELHDDWFKVSLHARLIGMELIALCKDPGKLQFATGDDWPSALCRVLRIDGPDRRNAKSALDRLVAAGFLHPEAGLVRITLDPVRTHHGSTAEPAPIPQGSVTDPIAIQKQPNDPEILNSDFTDREIDRQTEREKSPEAGPETVFRLKPLVAHPPKPRRSKESSPLAEFVQAEYVRMFREKTRTEPSTQGLRKTSRSVASWVAGNSAAYGLTNKALTERFLRGFFAHQRTIDAGFPLGWAVRTPHQYAGYPADSEASSPTASSVLIGPSPYKNLNRTAAGGE